MDSHNTKTDKVVSIKSVRIESDYDSVRVVQMDLADAANLAIEDELNPGGDPYNSTGQHVIIKPRTDLED